MTDSTPGGATTSIVAIVTERATVLIGVLAVALRMAWVARFAATPTTLSDPRIYHLAAEHIAAGDGYLSFEGTVTAYYPPGYPYALGWLYRLIDVVGLDGVRPHVVGVVQSVVWGVATISVIIVGRRLGGRVCGIAAGITIACWPNLVTYANTHLSESLFVALFACALVALTSATLAATPRATAVALVWSGVFVGMMTMVRPQGMFGVPLVAVAWWWSGRSARQIGALVLACTIGTAIWVVPWAIRNERVLGEPVLISTNTGDNLCLGFNPQANGGFGMFESCDTGEFYVDGPEAELRRDRENRAKAFEYIRSEPLSLPMLSIDKLWTTYSADDDGLRANEWYGGRTIMSPGWRAAWRFVSNLAYLAIAALTLAGAGLVGRRVRSRDEPIAAMLLLVGIGNFLMPITFFGDPRFKVASVPIFVVLAGFAVSRAVICLVPDPEQIRRGSGSADLGDVDDEAIVGA